MTFLFATTPLFHTIVKYRLQKMIIALLLSCILGSKDIGERFQK